MAKFDFIIGDEFRSSLEQDYEELYSSMQAKAWKAVHVLSGSIIEAILIDYLVSSEYQNKSLSELLKMNLADAISACRKEEVLSERTEHLSHVIRSYRNLIHPGRAVRLNEVADEAGANIAIALIEIIINEITQRRKQNYGYTGEQIIAKIEHDPSAVAILSHLLKDTNKHEIERLLLNLIPQKYFELTNKSTKQPKILSSLESCFRSSFELATEEAKEKLAKGFTKNIKEESSNVLWRYVFFRGSDLEYFSPEDRALVIKHFLSIMDDPLDDITLRAIKGIGKFLTSKEIPSFTIPFINSLAVYGHYYEDKYYNHSLEDIMNIFEEEFWNMDRETSNELAEFLLQRRKYNEEKDRQHIIKAIDSLYNKVFVFPSDYDALGDYSNEHPF